MSYTFSRRAFLKYSATTAVAMAGAGLLGGCEFKDPNNPVSKELPSTLTSRLQVIASLLNLQATHRTVKRRVHLRGGKREKHLSRADRIAEALSAGADEYVMKPFDGEILYSKLAEVGAVQTPS